MKLGGCVSLSMAAAVSVWASPPTSSTADSSSSRGGIGIDILGIDQKSVGILSFPLLNHHHVVERHRRELKAAGHDVDPTRHRLNHDRIYHRHHGNTSVQNNSDPNRSLVSPKQQVGALYQGYGTHYMDLWVGYPAQRQTVVIDTGSSVSAFPCSTCVNCGSHADPLFNELASESFIAKVCSVEGGGSGCIFGNCMDNGSCLISRTIGSSPGDDDTGSSSSSSWTAYEAEDIVYAAGLHDRAIDSPVVDLNPDDPANAIKFSFPLTFGCQMSASGYFEKQLASGVIGLDRRGQSFWGQMRASQLITRSHFSLCFGGNQQTPYGSTAGVVTLGGVDKRLHKTPMVFAKSAGDGYTASYKVQVRKMYLREGNDVSVMSDVTKKYHLIDASMEWLNGDQMYNLESATTDTYFIASVSGAFRILWREITGSDYTNEPMTLGNDSELLKLPTVVLQMIPHNGGIGDEVQTGDPREVNGLAGIVDMSTPNDVMLAIPPQHYMQNNNDGTYTPRIYLDRENALGNVLGANAMMGHDVMFDLEVGRIGFSESDCDYTRLISGSVGEGVGVQQEDGLLAAQQASENSDSSILCTSSRCFGLFAFTLILFLCTCFLFARRYVNRQENVTSDESTRDIESLSEFEMKMKSSKNKYPDGRYRDTPSSQSSSNGHNGSGRQSDTAPGSRKDQLINRDGDRESHYPDDRRRERYRDRRRSSRESDEGDFRSSAQSVYTNSSGTSGSSEGSRETRQSSRTHISSRSLGTHHSVRSSGSRQSARSNASRGSLGTRESHRTSGSSRRDQYDEGRSRYSDREYGNERSSSRRYGYHDDDIPRPPSIS